MPVVFCVGGGANGDQSDPWMPCVMGRSRVALTVLVCGALLAGCAEHRFEAEWQAWHDDCVAEGVFDRVDAGTLDSSGDDLDLVEDTCSEVVAEMSERYQDIPPNEIPQATMDAAFERIFMDCLEQDMMESDYC